MTAKTYQSYAKIFTHTLIDSMMWQKALYICVIKLTTLHQQPAIHSLIWNESKTVKNKNPAHILANTKHKR